jgi:hypothetical protein
MPESSAPFVPLDLPDDLDQVAFPEISWEGAHPIRAWWRRRKAQKAAQRAVAADAPGGATHR